MSINFKIGSTFLKEIAADSDEWTGDDIVTLTAEDISEMVKDDNEPMFVEIVALYEGLSGNNNHYTVEAVDSCVIAMPGTNMYKGHIPPGAKSHLYREPCARVISARKGYVEVEGKRVQAAIGKAYIFFEEQKLKADIRRKAAGPVSILGNGRTVRDVQTGNRKVTKIHAPLQSIDFCNPGTAGMQYAGVTSIVKEMTEEPIKPDSDEGKTMDRLTIDQLKAQYGQELNTIIAEMMDTQLKTTAEHKVELAEMEETHKTALKEVNATLSEIQNTLKTITEERDNLKEQLGEEKSLRLTSDLKTFAVEHIKSLKEADDADEKLIEMVTKDLEVNLINGDLEKSKDIYKTKIENEIKKATTLLQEIGGKRIVSQVTVTKHGGGGANDKLSRILSSDMQNKE